MSGRLDLTPRAEWQPAPRERAQAPTERCCAKCRRGVPGYGDLPCGYDLKCPNRCHEPKTETKETTP